MALCGGGEVYVVIAGTGAHDDFQFGGSRHHFVVDFVGAHDQCCCVSNGFEELGFFSVGFQEFHLIACKLKDVFDATHGIG